LIDWYFGAPRRAYGLICLACVLMLAFGLYLQHVVGLEPCPMCIVQRYALVLVALVAGIAAFLPGRWAHVVGGGVMALFSAFGAFTAARQSWLQWYPPEFSTCGRDLFGMIENFPLQRVIPMLFRGNGDCTKVDWTFLGLSIANWSFLWFSLFLIVGLVLAMRQWRRGSGRSDVFEHRLA
jgi:disulfide bond formation protein DsbB